MAQQPQLTKRERKEAARQARIEREQAAAAAAARKRRLTLIGGVLGAALIVVIIAIAVSSKGGSHPKNASSGGKLNGVAEMTAMLSGLQQSGNALGNPKAPVTLNEYADLQCPFCKEFAQQTLPLIVRDYVSTGKVRLVYKDLAFLGPDSEKAGAAAAAAGQQSHMWNYNELQYYNQGTENTGYVTDQYINKLYSAIPGLDIAKANAARKVSPATQSWVVPRQEANQFGISSTPSFTYGTTGGRMMLFQNASPTYSDFKKALDPLLKQ